MLGFPMGEFTKLHCRRQLNCDGPKELRLMKSLLIMVSERSLILERFGGKGLVYLDILDSPSTHETDYFTP